MMKRQQWALYAVAVAILVVVLAWVGVPASTLLIAGLVLVCPLTMVVMMLGMHVQRSDDVDQSTPLNGPPDRGDLPIDDSGSTGRHGMVHRSTHE